MSFQSKADECQRNINTVRKELKSREDQARKGEPTFFIDTQIKGGFSELVIQLLFRTHVSNNLKKFLATVVLIIRIKKS